MAMRYHGAQVWNSTLNENIKRKGIYDMFKTTPNKSYMLSIM